MEQRAVAKLVNEPVTEMTVFKRLRIKKTIYTSLYYRKVKSIDYFIQFSNKQIGKVHFYLLHRNTMLVVYEEFHVKNTNDHIIEVQAGKTINIQNVTEIEKKSLYMQVEHGVFGRTYYVTFIPNHFEKT